MSERVDHLRHNLRPYLRPIKPANLVLISRVFGFADWVGGRYSMWGPIGLSLMIAIDRDAFHAFLHGARSMDRHFAMRNSMKICLFYWRLSGSGNQVCDYATCAVLPYDQRLSRLPAIFNSLNGKQW